MDFFRIIKNFVKIKKPKVVSVPIDPESVSGNIQHRAILNENVELKMSNAKKDKIIAEFRQRKRDNDEEESVKKELNEQLGEIRDKNMGKFFSQKAFWRKYFSDKKFRKRLGIYSWDRKTKLANFGDLGISSNGDYILLDEENNQIFRSGHTKDLFQSVGALSIDMSNGMIPIWMDEEGTPMENVVDYEIPELIDTGYSLKYSKARKKPVFKVINRLNDEIGELRSDLAEAELTIQEQGTKINTLESERKVYEQMSQTSRAELTKNEDSLIGIDKAFRDTYKELLHVQGMSNLSEKENVKLRNQNQKLREESEREGTKLADEKALEMFQNVRATMVNELPDVETKKEEKKSS